MNKWCEYQKALYPVSLSKGRGSLMRFLLNHRVASMKAIDMKITIKIPVTPSHPLTRSIQLGLILPKSSITYAQSASDELRSLGKSHVRWFPAWRMIPTRMATAIIYRVGKQTVNKVTVHQKYSNFWGKLVRTSRRTEHWPRLHYSIQLFHSYN